MDPGMHAKLHELLADFEFSAGDDDEPDDLDAEEERVPDASPAPFRRQLCLDDEGQPTAEWNVMRSLSFGRALNRCLMHVALPLSRPLISAQPKDVEARLREVFSFVSLCWNLGSVKTQGGNAKLEAETKNALETASFPPELRARVDEFVDRRLALCPRDEREVERFEVTIDEYGFLLEVKARLSPGLAQHLERLAPF
jgi:hypothetical protein